MKIRLIPPVLVLILLLLPAATALKECREINDPSDVPCMVITTWEYPNPCNTYIITFYNITPSIIGEAILDDYGESGRCNTTFNFTKEGSYIWNVSSFDTGRMTIEETGGVFKVEFFNILVFAVLFGMSLIFISYMHRFKEDNSSIAYGFFAGSLLVILASLGFFGFQLITLDESIHLPFDVNYMISLVCIVMSIYCYWFSTVLLKNKNKRPYDEFGLNNY